MGGDDEYAQSEDLDLEFDEDDADVSAEKDLSQMELRDDHEQRPMWVCSDGAVFLETFSPIYKAASDFLVAIAEPIQRPDLIHEYRITRYSLYAAASMGLQYEDILLGLDKLSKNEIDPELIELIKDKTSRCGKVRLVLYKQRYFVESHSAEVLQILLKNSDIFSARIDDPAYPPPIPTSAIATTAGSGGSAPDLPVSGAKPTASSLSIGVVRETTVYSSALAARTGQQQLNARTQKKPVNSAALTQEQQMELAAAEAAEAAILAERQARANLSQSFTGGSSAQDPFVYRMVDGMVRDPVTSFLVGQNTSFNATGLDLPVAASQALTQSAQSAQLRAMGYDESDVKQVEDRQKQQQKSNYWFELHPDPKRVELVRRRCNDIQYPMLEEYEFRKDNAAALDLRIQLKPSASHRDYQVKALSKMFGNGRARSGIIVLPCGAGKTLTGITAATTIKKNTLVLATTNMAANQWKREFEKWTAVDPRDVVVFTSDNAEDITSRNPIVLISTYSMISFHGQRAIRIAEVIRDIKTREWGLVLLDEVHVVPANTFRECIGSTHSRCKLGLTATLVREDNLIEDLFFLIGPKLYEANWQDLSREGYLAKVQCVEVDCAMTHEFYEQYLKDSSQQQRMKMQVMNPNKFRACEYLVRRHEHRGDKVMVFADNIFALKEYARRLKRPAIWGNTSPNERETLLHDFKSNPNVNCLLISSIGDNSLDLPDVNVIIQISSHFAARRQEAQRLGRILRPKPRMDDNFNAFFYTLISTDTREMFYASKRQRYLVDQGYSFHVLREAELAAHYADMESEAQPYQLVKRQDQLDLLQMVLATANIMDEKEKVDPDFQQFTDWQRQAAAAQRKKRKLGLLSGDDGGTRYEEFNSRQAAKPSKSSFIANREAKRLAEKKENEKVLSLLKSA